MNIPFILSTSFVSNEDKSRLFNLEQYINMYDISTTEVVLKLFDNIRVSNCLFCANKFAISVTSEVSKLDKSKLVNWLQL